LGHKESKQLRESNPVMGWIGRLNMVGDSIRSSVSSVPASIAKAVRLKRYLRGSAELVTGYKEPSTGKRFPAVLRAFAFLGTDTPAITTLEDVANFESAGLELNVYEFALTNPETGQKQEPQKTEKEVKTNMAEIDEKELQALKAKAARADAAEQERDNAQGELTATFAQMKTRKIEGAWTEILTQGRATPAQKENFVRVAATLDDSNVLSFSDGEGKQIERTALDNFIADWKGRPVTEEYKQKSQEHRTDQEKTRGADDAAEDPWDNEEAWKENPDTALMAFADKIHKEEKDDFPDYADALIEAGRRNPELAKAHNQTQGDRTKGIKFSDQMNVVTVIR